MTLVGVSTTTCALPSSSDSGVKVICGVVFEEYPAFVTLVRVGTTTCTFITVSFPRPGSGSKIITECLQDYATSDSYIQ